MPFCPHFPSFMPPAYHEVFFQQHLAARAGPIFGYLCNEKVIHSPFLGEEIRRQSLCQAGHLHTRSRSPTETAFRNGETTKEVPWPSSTEQGFWSTENPTVVPSVQVQGGLGLTSSWIGNYLITTYKLLGSYLK